MLNNKRRTLFLAAALCLGACARTTDRPHSSASQGSSGIDAVCRSYSLGNSPDIKPPRLVRGDQPQPPEGGPPSGYVCVRVTITESGTVVDPVVVKTDNQEFAQVFVRALSQWRYEPATRGTARVPYHTVLIARFPPT